MQACLTADSDPTYHTSAGGVIVNMPLAILPHQCHSLQCRMDGGLSTSLLRPGEKMQSSRVHIRFWAAGPMDQTSGISRAPSDRLSFLSLSLYLIVA